MRYFIGIAALLLLISSGCSSTEPVQQESETSEPIEEESPIPSWYDPGVHSESDSLEIHGFALSSAMDSSRATELSTQAAIEHLRFEIDRIAEQARTELSDSDDSYNTPAFIIELRNSVSNLSLDMASLSSQHEITEQGIHYSYIKATILRTELPELFENSGRSIEFIDTIQSSLP